jgi:hypothetical protein
MKSWTVSELDEVPAFMLDDCIAVPAEILQLKELRGDPVETDCVHFLCWKTEKGLQL